MKNLICLFLVITFCLPLPLSASATSIELGYSVDSDNLYQTISNELSYYENNKSFVGLENVNFDNLQISDKISVYEYLPTGIFEIAEAHLLYENDKIVTLAYKSDEGIYEFMTPLAKRISQIEASNLSIVYDNTGCFIYNGEAFINIYVSNYIIETRNSIAELNDSVDFAFDLCNIENKHNFIYNPLNPLTRSLPQNVFCSVDFVGQQYNNICWAACIAMISNSINNTSLTDVDVASSYFGTNVPSGFNKTISMRTAKNIMNNTYGLNYIYKNEIPTEDVILDNILNGTPILAKFDFSYWHHAVVIYGINVLAGRMMIMNPNYGSMTCYYNSEHVYYYTDIETGIEFTISEAICRTW